MNEMMQNLVIRIAMIEEKMVSDMALKILSYNAETSIKELKKLEIFYDEE